MPSGSTLDDLPGTFTAPLVDVAAGTTADVTPTERTTISAIAGWGLTVELDIPAGAVDRNIRVSVRPVSIGGYLGLRLEPEGLVLNRPATLRFIPDAASSPSLKAPVYVRDGWGDDGTERFAPRWRTADQTIAIYRLRPVMVLRTFPAAPDIASGDSTTTTLAPPTTVAPTTTTTIAVPPVPDAAPTIDWASEIAPVLDDFATESANATDRAAWVLEHRTDEGADDSAKTDALATVIQGTAETRLAYLSEKCADRTSKPRHNEELSNIINGTGIEWADVKTVEGCLELVWQVSTRVQAEYPLNGEIIPMDEYQLAQGQVLLDAGSGTAEAPIFGYAHGSGAVMSVMFSALAKGASEMTGVDDPYGITSKLCGQGPDQQSGSVSVQFDPLANNEMRMKIMPSPGTFEVGCGEGYRVPPTGWDLVRALRGDPEGGPIILTFPVKPQVSRNNSFLSKAEGATVRLTEGKPAQITVAGMTLSVDFIVTLAFAPLR